MADFAAQTPTGRQSARFPPPRSHDTHARDRSEGREQILLPPSAPEDEGVVLALVQSPQTRLVVRSPAQTPRAAPHRGVRV